MFAINGTPCKLPSSSPDGIDALCLSGACTPVGCDRALGSTLARDRCGVCGGSGDTCVEVKGSHPQGQDGGIGGFLRGYEYIETFPALARNLVIHEGNGELLTSNNYISLAFNDSA